MQRKAIAAGMDKRDFKKNALQISGGYDTVKQLVAGKRGARKAKAAGRNTQPFVANIIETIEELDLDFAIEFGS